MPQGPLHMEVDSTKASKRKKSVLAGGTTLLCHIKHGSDSTSLFAIFYRLEANHRSVPCSRVGVTQRYTRSQNIWGAGASESLSCANTDAFN